MDVGICRDHGADIPDGANMTSGGSYRGKGDPTVSMRCTAPPELFSFLSKPFSAGQAVSCEDIAWAPALASAQRYCAEDVRYPAMVKFRRPAAAERIDGPDVAFDQSKPNRICRVERSAKKTSEDRGAFRRWFF
jgi:hypothetical protein